MTTPHAWRIAFSRYFPGSEALPLSETSLDHSNEVIGILISDKRVFTRLTTLASWRSEYILRTRLLRSLVRGKPAEFQGPGGSGSSRLGGGPGGNAQITYNSNLFTTVNHLHATFGTGLNKRLPRFIHGADENGSASSSDPSNGRVDHWGFLDPRSFQQFTDRFPGDSEYGLGSGDIVGVPNTMDVSKEHGMAYAEGFPGGIVYFRSADEQRGRVLARSTMQSFPELGIPRVNVSMEANCSIWIAKSSNIPSLTEGLFGIITGSSSGVLSAYSLGTDSLRERRLERGELTARWILSPGIPIIAICLDENFSRRRRAQNRIWAVVLNALGEVFTLVDIPIRRMIDRATKLTEGLVDQIAWETGRTVPWTLLEQTRRFAKPDPFARSGVDGSYSPQSSWDGAGLSKQQIIAETREIEQFIIQKPKHFRKICEGWDMRRRLIVDFAGDDGNGAGEGIITFGCGLDEGPSATIQRFTRVKVEQPTDKLSPVNEFPSPTPSKPTKSDASMFGATPQSVYESTPCSFAQAPLARSSSVDQFDFQRDPKVVEEWRTSVFSFGGLKATQITSMAMDMSTFALSTISEDPLLSMDASSVNSSPMSSPLGQMPRPGSPSDVPGQRARLFAVGTKLGTILIWNARSSSSGSHDLVNNIQPVRIIHTDSPRISCLALSALYLVHGGNDGLVQAWDPLASNTQPIRTLNSRFSSRARRRLLQAEASPQGVGINLFAAGALCLDPDPTVLRGMVSLGTHLRYWSYSSSAADQYKGSKRRLRRSERGSNQGGDRFSGSGRGALKDYIANEKLELEREKESRRKEKERLSGRFGVDLLGPGASEDEILAYATLLSEEAARADDLRRESVIKSNDDTSSSVIVTEEASSPLTAQSTKDAAIDADIAEAIRLSLQDDARVSSSPFSSPGPAIDFPVKYAKKRRSPSTSPPQGRGFGEPSGDKEAEDLDFALQLSMVEEESRRDVDVDVDAEFPELPSPSKGSSLASLRKGKGKGREKGT